MSLIATPCRRLMTRLFYLDAEIAELLECDALYGDPDGTDPAVARVFDEAAEIRTELARREKGGIEIDDPDEPTLEERLAPFGIEWQIEQEERAAGY